MSGTPPPKHLSKVSQSLWKKLVPKRVKTLEQLVLLKVALEALDRGDEARRRISDEGLTITTPETGAVHLHPAWQVEQQARQQFLRAWCDLGFAGANACGGTDIEV